MITQWSVLSLLKQLTDIGEEEEKLCLGIALSSLERVNSRLKADADSSLKFAASVRDSALAELTPLLSDDGFFCCGVEI